jgi:hypothetical protein
MPYQTNNYKACSLDTIRIQSRQKEYLDWLLHDEAAQGVIKGACEDSQLPHVKNCTTSKELWEALRKVHFTNQACINIHYFFEDLYT